jgi:triosephosphate isomerase (TIM)
MRRIYIAGNWKLNLNQSETKSFLDELKPKVTKVNENISVLVHPSFTSLMQAQSSLEGTAIQFGAQNCSNQDKGAFTGEVSIKMLKETGISSIIIGHSERREIFKETNENINAKLKAIREEATLTAIVCCGESEATRENGETDTWVEKQIEEAFKGISLDSSNIEKIVIAYEPIWAIGTGKTCDSNEANRVIQVIRAKFASLYSQDLADKVSILYGGSVKASNIEELLKTSDIDGALIGGASLMTDEFASIIDKSNSLLASTAA